MTDGRPEKRIPALAKAAGATAVHVSADFTPFGRRRDDAVREALGDIPLESSGSPYLVSPGRVTRVAASRTRCSRRSSTPGESTAGARRPSRPRIGSLDRSGRRRGRHRGPRRGVELDLPAGERAARRQWKSFVSDELAGYADERTGLTLRHQPDVGAPQVRHDPPPHHGRRSRPRQRRAGVSARVGFSRLLRRGALRMARQRVVELEQELRPHRGRRRQEAEKPFEAWKAGKTGFPIVDAGCANWPRPAGCTTGCG